MNFWIINNLTVTYCGKKDPPKRVTTNSNLVIAR